MPHPDPDQAVDDLSVDVETLREVLEHHPVRLAVLFGSEVTGETHPRSDVDVTVEFEESVEDVSGEFLALHSALARALQRDDIDLSMVPDLKPRVGLAAFEEGVLLVGSEDRMEALRERFERAVEAQDAQRPSLRERFDAVIRNVDTTLRGES